MLAGISHYLPPNPSLWRGREDSLPNERFFQHVTCIDIQSQPLSDQGSGTVITGFASDEGIRRNLGRTGAATGPQALRQELAKLACHFSASLIDIGDIVPNDALEQGQEELATVLDHCHQRGFKTLVFGGGHEIAWGHYLGLSQRYPRLGIINFDAHFDLRFPHQGSTSGTPFQQIAEFCQQKQRSFDYCCLGIQSSSNTESLFSLANKYKVSYLTAAQMNQNSFAWQTAFLDDFMLNHEAIYLTVCLDVFAESFAPGVSAPQALGLTPWQVLPLLKYITQTGKVVSIDIAELSPPLDQGQKTARLAAALAAQLLEFN
ncbi:formimidoylglutamase [Legionella sp. MW5194]|uniref:formimidoylglutamase n=1 Tax=Legionella sp. MW5194 TaxID=2662448 RepID=UPI00193D3AE9|nr:formimidoylglutamase [Legionella sp. MW5194]QRN04393.1 formimidoylglutamase [Legionella sp. MW5194]